MAADDPEKAMDVTDESEEEDHEGSGDHKTLTSELLKNPAIMSALQGKLDSMAGSASGYIKVNMMFIFSFLLKSFLFVAI